MFEKNSISLFLPEMSQKATKGLTALTLKERKKRKKKHLLTCTE
jgi:hypothetical protein